MQRSLAIVLLAGACASGGLAGQDPKSDAPPERRDAAFVVQDAPSSHNDAHVVDAFVPKDAPALPDSGGGGLFCNGNSDCTTAGQCCVILGSPPGLCANGVIVLGACIPQ